MKLMERKRKWFFFPAAVIAAAVLLFAACPADDDDKSGEDGVTYTVTFNLGYTGGTAPDPIKIAEGESALNAFPSDPTRADYLFSGWFSGETKYTKFTPVTADVTLTAQWEALYTVTFNIGYEGAASPEPIILRSGQSGGILFPPDPVREDYIFRGWLDGTGTRYYQTSAVTASVTLTARWLSTATAAVITLVMPPFGIAEVEPLAVEKNQPIGDQFPAAPVLPEHFTFTGWFDGDTQYTAETTVSDDITLTGKWTKDEGVERITARNAGNPVFKFTVPVGDRFGDYTKITVKFLLNDENESTAAPVIRLYGSYAAADFIEQADRYWKGPPGTYLMFNNNMERPSPLPQYEWFTVEIPFTLAKYNEGDFTARFPKDDATGDFYFALGLSLGGGTASATHVTSYMTEVTLSNDDGSKTIVSTGGGFDKPAMIGNDVSDITRE